MCKMIARVHWRRWYTLQLMDAHRFQCGRQNRAFACWVHSASQITQTKIYIQLIMPGPITYMMEQLIYLLCWKIEPTSLWLCVTTGACSCDVMCMYETPGNKLLQPRHCALAKRRTSHSRNSIHFQKDICMCSQVVYSLLCMYVVDGTKILSQAVWKFIFDSS